MTTLYEYIWDTCEIHKGYRRTKAMRSKVRSCGPSASARSRPAQGGGGQKIFVVKSAPSTISTCVSTGPVVAVPLSVVARLAEMAMEREHVYRKRSNRGERGRICRVLTQRGRGEHLFWIHTESKIRWWELNVNVNNSHYT